MSTLCKPGSLVVSSESVRVSLRDRVEGTGRESVSSVHQDYGIRLTILWALGRDSPGIYQFGALSLYSWRNWTTLLKPLVSLAVTQR